MTRRGMIKERLITSILMQNKIAMELFNTEILQYEELYKLNIMTLKNVNIELQIQIGLKRNYSSCSSIN